MSNYIFISYSHKDKDKVVPIIDKLRERGYEIWYDKGIEVGSEWGKIIADKLNDCRVMIIFMSQNYVNSPNCNRETTYAVSHNKQSIVVYLKETELTSNLELNICTWPAFYRQDFDNDNEFVDELCNSKILGVNDNLRKNEEKYTSNEMRRIGSFKYPPFHFSLGIIYIVCALLNSLSLNDSFPDSLYFITFISFFVVIILGCFFYYQSLCFLRFKFKKIPGWCFFFIIILSLLFIFVLVHISLVLNFKNYKFKEKIK